MANSAHFTPLCPSHVHTARVIVPTDNPVSTDRTPAVATPTDDEIDDAIAEDLATGVKSVTDGDQTTTLESPVVRQEANERRRKNKAAKRGVNGILRVSRAVPPGAGPQ